MNIQTHTGLRHCLPSANITLVGQLIDKVEAVLNARGISIDVYSNIYEAWPFILAYGRTEREGERRMHKDRKIQRRTYDWVWALKRRRWRWGHD
jgi:hypothetical protein